MAKPDFPALLVPGVHDLSLGDLHALAVAPFPEDRQRATLYQNLTNWTAALSAYGVGGTLWVDGSFLTEKPGPSDIDCVFWSPYWGPAARQSPADMQQVTQLLDGPTAKNLFGLDLYLEMPEADELLHRQAYWRGLFGFCHDRVTAKGLAEVRI